MDKKISAAALIVAALVWSTPARAELVGYYDLFSNNTGTVGGQPYDDTYPEAPIKAAGHTPVRLSELSAASLAGIKVLFALNPDNDKYGQTYLDALPTIANAVNNGMVLCFADRHVTAAAGILPGGSGISFTRIIAGDIDILDTNTLVTDGPGGVLNNSSLDGGTGSIHGYAEAPSLPTGNRVILTTNIATQAVTFSYPQGAGAVVYTSTPLDHYLNGGTAPTPETLHAFKNIYAPNLVAYCASVVSEPAPIESSSLGPINLRYCHSAAHTGDAACARVVSGQTVPTTGKVASQDAPTSACTSGEPTKGTANIRVVANDAVAFGWTGLDCGNETGDESFAINPTKPAMVGNVVQLKAERFGTIVGLRVVPRETEYDVIDNATKGIKRIVVESFNDGKILEKWAINGDERISVQLAAPVPEDVITSAAVRFWVGHTRFFGAKRIIATASLNGTFVGEETRVLSAAGRTTFTELQVYTPGNFDNKVFDKLEFRAGSGSYFGIGSVDLNTARPASP